MRSQRAQNAAVAQVNKLWCSHPKPLNHPAFHDYLMVLGQMLLNIPKWFKQNNSQNNILKKLEIIALNKNCAIQA